MPTMPDAGLMKIQPTQMFLFGHQISGKVGEEAVELCGELRSDGNHLVQGTVGQDRVEVRASGSRGTHSIRGRGLAGELELSSQRTGCQARVTGKVGQYPVSLRARCWPGSDQATIEGEVGGNSVRLSQYSQIDGYLVTGYVGDRYLFVRQRGPATSFGLEPVEYLAAMIPAPAASAWLYTQGTLP